MDPEKKVPETEEYLTHIFKEFAKTVEREHPSWFPKMLTRGHAKQFVHAMRNAFGEGDGSDDQNFKIVDSVCYFHVAQANHNQRHIKSNFHDKDTAEEMKDLIAHFHYATTEHFRLGWELAVRELSEFPVWARFLQLQENAGRGPRGSNESWVATYEDNNGIECWHGELKKKAQSLGSSAGHLCLRRCVELVCVMFSEIEKLLNTNTTGLEMPMFFEYRERLIKELRAAATDGSLSRCPRKS